MRARLRRNRVALAVLAVAAVALALRLHALGARLAHWDEARVAWWTLQFLETGTHRYYPILHGPFLFHVNRWVFEVLGPSDASARLVVALVGGLLPVAALGFRSRLDDAETVALATLLAADPLLLYYSRFMRNDLLVAAFSLAALALLVRGHDTGRARYGVAAGPVLALAFATKENAVLYLLCWVAAAAAAGLVRERESAPLADLSGHAAAARRVVARQLRTAGLAVRNHPAALAAAAAGFLVVTVFFYAPRGGDGPSLGGALADPSLWPAVLGEATLGSVRELVDLWLLGGLQGGSYPWFLALLAGMLVVSSGAVVALAAYGLHRERSQPRWFVVFAGVWGLLSLLGYPAAVDIVGGWTAVNVVVPMTVPAAVGLVALARRARPALRALAAGVRELAGAGGDPPDAPGPGHRRAALALVLVVGQVAVVGGLTSYAYPGHQENVLGQPAQGGDDLKPTIEAAVAVAHDNEGMDVAFYGSYFAAGVPRRQPMAWYLRAADHGRTGPERVRVAALTDRAALAERAPPVVVALSYQHEDVRTALPGYRCFSHEFAYWSDREPGGRATDYNIYIEPNALAAVGGREGDGASYRCGEPRSSMPLAGSGPAQVAARPA